MTDRVATENSDVLSNAQEVLAQLIAHPQRFSFDAAFDILRRVVRDPFEDIHFHTAPTLVTPTNEVIAVSRRNDGGFDVTTGFGGLVGPDGTLPRSYSALAIEEHRKRSNAFTDFLDMLAQRPIGQFAQAGAKYRARADLSVTDDNILDTEIARALLSFTGFSPEKLYGIPAAQILYFSGLLQYRPRSAERLRAILSEWLCVTVEIDPFKSHWVEIESSEQTALPAGTKDGQYTQLGKTAVIGSRQWDAGNRLEIKIGPLSLAQFESLRHPAPLMLAVSSLIRAYLDDDIYCFLKLILKKEEVPEAKIGNTQLGTNGWITATRPRTEDVADYCINVKSMTA